LRLDHSGSRGTRGGPEAEEAPAAQPVAFDGSTFYDAVVVFGDPKPWLTGDQDACRFVRGAYRHGKPIGVLSRPRTDVQAALAEVGDAIGDAVRDGEGVAAHRDPEAATSAFTQRLLSALEQLRFPGRGRAIPR